jgi:hypothetical protein
MCVRYGNVEMDPQKQSVFYHGISCVAFVNSVIRLRASTIITGR